MTQFSTLTGRLLDIELGTDDSTVLFTTVRRNAAVNDGIREFADLTECWRKQAIVSINSTQFVYNLNSSQTIPHGDFVRLAAERPVEYTIRSSAGSSDVTVLSGPDLMQRSLQWYQRYRPSFSTDEQSSSPRSPDSYYLLRDAYTQYLGFSPFPSSGTGTSQVLAAVVNYVALPQRLSSATDEPFQEAGVVAVNMRPYHQATVHYAAAQLEKLRKNTEASQSQMAAFLAYVQRYLADARPKGGMMLSYAKDYFTRRIAELDPRR